MGRPKPSEQVQDFAFAFACAVTTPSASISDYVARSGEFSLFALLGRLAPKVHAPSRSVLISRSRIHSSLNILPGIAVIYRCAKISNRPITTSPTGWS